MRAALVGFFVAALALAACPEQVEEPDDEGAGGAVDVVTYAESACGQCALAACVTHKDACAADPGCAAHLDCLMQCPLSGDDIDPACLEACPLPESAAGTSSMEALHACRTSGPGKNCEGCGMGTGGGHPILDQECPASTEADACARCEAENCCETPCDGDCEALYACTELCPSYACIDQCFTDHPDGFAADGANKGCMAYHCRDSCPWITTNACLDCGLEFCPELLVDCFAYPDCYWHFQCSQRCDFGDAACENACDAKYPEGAAMWSDFIYCVAEHCAGACPAGPTP